MVADGPSGDRGGSVRMLPLLERGSMRETEAAETIFSEAS